MKHEGRSSTSSSVSPALIRTSFCFAVFALVVELTGAQSPSKAPTQQPTKSNSGSSFSSRRSPLAVAVVILVLVAIISGCCCCFFRKRIHTAYQTWRDPNYVLEGGQPQYDGRRYHQQQQYPVPAQAQLANSVIPMVPVTNAAGDGAYLTVVSTPVMGVGMLYGPDGKPIPHSAAPPPHHQQQTLPPQQRPGYV